jgi:hypothetical protein
MNATSIMLPNGKFLTIECGGNMLSLYSGIPEYSNMDERICVISSSGIWVNGNAGEMFLHLVDGLCSNKQIDLMDSLPSETIDCKKQEQIAFLESFTKTWGSASDDVQDHLARAYEKWCRENNLPVVSAEWRLEAWKGGAT